MDYSSKQAAIESVREAVARGRAVIEVDGEVVWLHPDKVHSVNSVYASDEQGAIALYAILVGQTMGYDWAYEAHGLRKPDPDQPSPKVVHDYVPFGHPPFREPPFSDFRDIPKDTPNVIPGTLIVLAEYIGYDKAFTGLVVALAAFSPMCELEDWLEANPEQRGDDVQGITGCFDQQAFVNSLKARRLVAEVSHGVFTLGAWGSPDEANFIMDA